MKPSVEANETSSSPIRPPESFTFVLNVSDLGSQPNYELAPGHFLRRATPQEQVTIKEILQHFAFGFSSVPYQWEARLPHPGGQVELLPETDWRYYVLAFRGTNDIAHELEQASYLAPCELEFGFTVIYQDFGTGPMGGIQYYSGALFQTIDSLRLSDEYFVPMLPEAAQTISELRNLVHALDSSDPLNIKRLLMQIRHLRSLPRKSPLLFLGYFGVLESLLTHAPKPADPYDSITRQVKKKLNLLNHRWRTPLDYSVFGATTHEMIWSKMYGYRSVLAHGGTADFKTDLKILKNHDQALRLLRDTVKAVTRQALYEPQLLTDLKEC